jgi:glyoxylase I family protein
MAAITPLGLDHVVLRVADIDRACRWYETVLGARVERTLPGIGLTQLRVGASLIDLVPIPAGEARATEGNMDHFCVALATFDEAAIRAHLEAHGVTPAEVARRYGARGHGPSMYLTDPDGNMVELKGPPDADQTERAPGATGPQP